jgi:hypothetical protein
LLTSMGAAGCRKGSIVTGSMAELLKAKPRHP